MNRHERRRRTKVGRVLNISLARYTTDENAVPMPCYVCGNLAEPWPWPDGPAATGYGMAQIEDDGRVDHVPLCEHCIDDDRAVARKWLKAPNVVIHDGGEATPEHIAEMASALAERESITSH